MLRESFEKGWALKLATKSSNIVGVWREMDALKEEQVTPGAGDRESRESPRSWEVTQKVGLCCVSEQALEFTLLGTSSVALGTSLGSRFGLHFLHL